MVTPDERTRVVAELGAANAGRPGAGPTPRGATGDVVASAFDGHGTPATVIPPGGIVRTMLRSAGEIPPGRILEAEMEAAAHAEHHAMPTSGSALTKVALSATLHCLTGCAIGEVAGMLIGTALGFSNLATVALSVLLAFVFGYGLTSLPLLRAGLALAAVVPIALASDTLSIATMELVDNAIMLTVPGAMDAGLGALLFWGSLAFSLVIAGAVAVPVNRWLIARGKGHAVVHETGIHGGLPPRVVAIAAAVAFVFGASVLLAEALSSDDAGHDANHSAVVRR